MSVLAVDSIRALMTFVAEIDHKSKLVSYLPVTTAVKYVMALR